MVLMIAIESIDLWRIESDYTVSPNVARRLYSLAIETADIAGDVVEIGCWKGRSTCFLAAGCRDSGGIVIAVDPFTGSPDYALGGKEPSEFLAKHGSTLDAFRINIRDVGLQEYVSERVGYSTDVARSFRGACRLLFIDGDHRMPEPQRDFEAWFPFVSPGGAICFDDVGNAHYPELREYVDSLKYLPGLTFVEQIENLAVFSKTSDLG